MALVESSSFMRSVMSEDVEFSTSNIHGKGLLVNKDVEEGSFIHVTHVHKDLCELANCENTWINLHPNHLYNHSKKNENCKVVTEGLTKGLITTKHIPSGQELLVDYTKDKDLEQPQSGWKA